MIHNKASIITLRADSYIVSLRAQYISIYNFIPWSALSWLLSLKDKCFIVVCSQLQQMLLAVNQNSMKSLHPTGGATCMLSHTAGKPIGPGYGTWTAPAENTNRSIKLGAMAKHWCKASEGWNYW